MKQLKAAERGVAEVKSTSKLIAYHKHMVVEPRARSKSPVTAKKKTIPFIFENELNGKQI